MDFAVLKEKLEQYKFKVEKMFKAGSGEAENLSKEVHTLGHELVTHLVEAEQAAASRLHGLELTAAELRQKVGALETNVQSLLSAASTKH